MIAISVARDYDRLPMLGDPSGNALSELQLEMVDEIGMGIARCAQNQLIALEDIDEAGVALRNRNGKFDDVCEQIGQGRSRGDALRDVVQERGIKLL